VHLVDEIPIATLDLAAELGEDSALLPLIPRQLLLAARCGEDADNSVSEDVDIASVDSVDEKDTLLRLFRAQLGGRDRLSWAVKNIVHVEAMHNAVDTLLRKLASLRQSFPGGEPMAMSCPAPRALVDAVHRGIVLKELPYLAVRAATPSIRYMRLRSSPYS